MKFLQNTQETLPIKSNQTKKIPRSQRNFFIFDGPVGFEPTTHTIKQRDLIGKIRENNQPDTSCSTLIVAPPLSYRPHLNNTTHILQKYFIYPVE